MIVSRLHSTPTFNWSSTRSDPTYNIHLTAYVPHHNHGKDTNPLRPPLGGSDSIRRLRDHPNSRHLALIGDIGYTRDDGLFSFLRSHLSKFKIIFHVLGNHEPYHSSYGASKWALLSMQEETERSASEGMGNSVLLDQTRYDLSSTVTILGCTLFSAIMNAQKDYVSFGLNDFYHTGYWGVDEYVLKHEGELNWLNGEVQKLREEEEDRQIIIMTQYSPTADARSINPQHESSNISSGFMTDLSQDACMQSDQVKVWKFGHTHSDCDFESGESKMRLVTNQRGYFFKQADDSEPEKVVEL